MLFLGACIGYYSGDTRKVLEDCAALRPTVFAGVPRVYERVYTGVMDKVGRGTGALTVWGHGAWVGCVVCNGPGHILWHAICLAKAVRTSIIEGPEDILPGPLWLRNQQRGKDDPPVSADAVHSEVHFPALCH